MCQIEPHPTRYRPASCENTPRLSPTLVLNIVSRLRRRRDFMPSFAQESMRIKSKQETFHWVPLLIYLYSYTIL